MSTSTVTSTLSHIYYSVANYKSPHFNNLTETFDHEPMKFMLSQRKPNTIFLRQVTGPNGKKLYAVDNDSGFTE